MKFQFSYIIFVILLFIGCSKRASKEANDLSVPEFEFSETSTETSIVSEEEAYKILVTQKLKALLDEKQLIATHPKFKITSEAENIIGNTTDTLISNIEFIDSFQAVSDSVQSVKTKIIYPTAIDTILTIIKTSTITIDGEPLKTTQVYFERHKTKVKNNN